MIVPMRKVKLFFMDENKEQILRALQAYALIMPDERHKQALNPSDDLVKTSKAIEILEGYVKKSNIGNNAVITQTEFETISDDTKALVTALIDAQQEYIKVKDELDSVNKSKNTLLPYESLSIATHQFKKLKYFEVILGKISSEKVEGIQGLSQSLDVFIDVVSQKDNTSYLAVIVTKEDAEQFSHLAEQAGFVREQLADYAQKNTFILTFFDEEISRHQAKLAEIESYFVEQTKELGALKILFDQLQSQDMRHQISFLKTQQTLYLEGWIRSDQIDQLNHILTSKELPYEVELRDPLPDELIPTALKNNAFVQPFEMITNQFSVPSTNEIDPNPLMSFWYWLIFGLMMGDMGYGVVMVALFGGMLLAKTRGGIRDLAKVFFLTGISSIIAGALFGSLFGFTVYNPVFDPVNDPVPMLILSLGLGIAHLICALIMKVITSLRQGAVVDALASGFSWIAILLGLVFVVLDMAVTSIPFVGVILVGIGVVLIVVFNGYSKPTIGGKLLSAFTGLYNSTSYLSDLLSYSRILALALSSAVIAYTMNLLADLVGGGQWWGIFISIPIYLAGHAFNFVMGLLSAYVHAGRLQYLEYYGKFYEGGGFLFNPLKLELKYVYNVTTEKQ